MELSHAGIIADILWHEIKNHAKKAELGEFVVMPNHVHGILILCGNENDDYGERNGNGNGNVIVETTHALSLPLSKPPPPEKTIGQMRCRNQGKNSVSSIIGSWKSAVSKHCGRLDIPFDWQSRFHDHVIRNDHEYIRIANYIIHNPENWNEDKFYDP